MTKKTRWTEDDLAQLTTLLAQGKLGSDIAIELGRTWAAVVAQARLQSLEFAPGQLGQPQAKKDRTSSSFRRVFGD